MKIASVVFLLFTVSICSIAEGETEKKPKPEILKIAAKPEAGFNWEYLLYIPKKLKDGPIHLYVEPNNTGRQSDDHEVHFKRAWRLVEKGYAHRIAKELGMPLLIPVVDRPQSEYLLYTHALDRDCLLKKDGRYKRLDLQLIAMVEDAKELLLERGQEMEEKIIMHGFSASGNYVDRFVALHPDLVSAAAYGGINSRPFLPLESSPKEESLIYPVGFGDYEELTGEVFDMKAFRKVPRFVYMGELDTNDTFPYAEPYGEDEKRLIQEMMGPEMWDQWAYAEGLFEEKQVNAQFVVYEGIAHGIPDHGFEDIIRFFRQNMDGEWKPIQPTQTVAQMKNMNLVPNLEKGMVHRALYVGHPDIPEWVTLKRGEFLLLIEEWIPERDYNQMSHLISKLDSDELTVIIETGEGDRVECSYTQLKVSSGNGDFQGFTFRIPDEFISQSESSSKITVHPNPEMDVSVLEITDNLLLEKL
ncbi:MAG: hypothetical protein MI748_14925 [Opitutales bacterium]|nr:hypothetical protein [Opitutales bacterium]